MHPRFQWLIPAASVAVALLLLDTLQRFLGEDQCLDRGGRVLAATRQCELASGQVVLLEYLPNYLESSLMFLGVVVACSLLARGLVKLISRTDHHQVSALYDGEAPPRE
jgi:hypothetical protein